MELLFLLVLGECFEGGKIILKEEKDCQVFPWKTWVFLEFPFSFIFYLWDTFFDNFNKWLKRLEFSPYASWFPSTKDLYIIKLAISIFSRWKNIRWIVVIKKIIRLDRSRSFSLAKPTERHLIISIPFYCQFVLQLLNLLLFLNVFLHVHFQYYLKPFDQANFLWSLCCRYGLQLLFAQQICFNLICYFVSIGLF